MRVHTHLVFSLTPGLIKAFEAEEKRRARDRRNKNNKESNGDVLSKAFDVSVDGEKVP